MHVRGSGDKQVPPLFLSCLEMVELCAFCHPMRQGVVQVLQLCKWGKHEKIILALD